MRVRENLNDLVLAANFAQSMFDSVPEEMRRIVEAFAKWEQETHSYINRTGRLNSSTRGVVTERSGRVSAVSLVMGNSPSLVYASYIVGVGLSNIEQAGEEARKSILEYLESLPKKLSSKLAA